MHVRFCLAIAFSLAFLAEPTFASEVPQENVGLIKIGGSGSDLLVITVDGENVRITNPEVLADPIRAVEFLQTVERARFLENFLRERGADSTTLTSTLGILDSISSALLNPSRSNSGSSASQLVSPESLTSISAMTPIRFTPLYDIGNNYRFGNYFSTFFAENTLTTACSSAKQGRFRLVGDRDSTLLRHGLMPSFNEATGFSKSDDGETIVLAGCPLQGTRSVE